MFVPIFMPPAIFATAPSFYDEKATALLAEIAAKGKSLKSFSAEVTMTMTGPQSQKMTGKLLIQTPSKGRVEFTPEKGEKILMLQDGKSSFNITGKKYTKGPLSPNNEEIWPFLTSVPGADPKKFTHAGTEKVGEITFEVLETKEGPQTIRVYVSPEKVIQRVVMSMEAGGQKAGQEIVLSNIQLDTELAAENFTLPAGLEEAKAPGGGGGNESLEAKLLKVGAKAPVFTLPALAGTNLSLAQALQGKKALILNFWFYG
jgi:outer membrane lipoprotein-sorting protein